MSVCVSSVSAAVKGWLVRALVLAPSVSPLEPHHHRSAEGCGRDELRVCALVVRLCVSNACLRNWDHPLRNSGGEGGGGGGGTRVWLCGAVGARKAVETSHYT